MTINRSVATTDQLHTEIFTPEDYLEARLFEDYLDAEALKRGLPVEIEEDQATQMRNDAIIGLQLPDPEALDGAVGDLLSSIESTCETLGASTLIPNKDERQAFIGNSARELYNLKPFNQQLRYLAARYVVEFVERRGDNLPDTWQEAIRQASDLFYSLPNIATRVHSVDIPAYSVLYDEFDKLRQDRDSNLEVYLGRDGIYAYYGRLGQNAARGDNDPTTASFPLHPAQVALRPDPAYIVYSRGVMASATPEERERYLLQFIDQQEVHFYDTGYQGSIPEDIMRILGFSKAEIDQRIFLLNSNTDERQLQGLGGHIDIETIENSAKNEHAASGLREQDGIMKYKTSPTILEEQFRFLFIRDILLRHFWIKEYTEITAHLAEIAVQTSPLN